MIVRLQNLSARSPSLSDLEAVTALFIVYEVAESGFSDSTSEDVHNGWQAPGFNMKTDAWVIVTHKGQIVGYTDVHQHENDGQFVGVVLVHPDYIERGIGTLLLWLMEERARQLMRRVPLRERVILSMNVSSLKQGMQHHLEHEGYTHLRSFWRLHIEMDGMAEQTLDNHQQSGKLNIDLVVDAQNLLGLAHLQRRTGLYVARQYDVYEKELRAGEVIPLEGEYYREPVGV